MRTRNMDQHVMGLAAAVNRNTWASAAYNVGAIQPSRGLQAGVPLADIAFILAVSVTTKNIRTNLAAEGLGCAFATDGAAQYFGVNDIAQAASLEEISIIDDAVYPVVATAGQLIHKVQRTAQIVHEGYRRHGLTLNYLATKAAAVVTWSGPGSHQANINAHKEKGTYFQTRDGWVWLPFVPKYKHVGNISQPNNHTAADVARKTAIMSSTAKPLSKNVLGNRAIEQQLRVQLATTLVFTTGLFSAAVWPTLPARQMARLHMVMLTTYRQIANMQRWRKQEGANDARVLLTLKVPMPRLQLMMMRVRLLRRIVMTAHTAMLTILYQARHSTNSWVVTVLSDANWFANAGPKLADYRNTDMQRWVAFVMSAPTQVDQLLHNIAMEATARACNACLEGAVPVHIDAPSHTCDHCNAEFPTYQQFAVHTARAHKTRREARRYVTGVTCPICLRNFDNRPRLIDHLTEKSETCMINILIQYPPLPTQEVVQLDAEDLEMEKTNRRRCVRHTHGEQPVLQALGPVRPIFVVPGHSRQTRFPLMRPALLEARTLDLAAHLRLGGVQSQDITELIADLTTEPTDDIE